jgi:PPOX class probable FMN-dependent enzyme
MIYPAWRQQLSRSLHLSRSKPEAKYFQVASVALDGLPCVRTMVFRDYLEDTNSLLAVNDIRSEKFEQWQAQSDTQLHWYFVKSREQYRLSCKTSMVYQNESGSLVIAGKDAGADISNQQQLFEMYEKQWSKLSEKAQDGFYCPKPKSRLSDETGKGTGTQSGNEKQELKSKDDISPYFSLVVFKPYYVDYLDLKTQPHTRVLQSRESLADGDNNWTLEPVTP